MASSEYLSARSEDNSDAKKSALYTEIMYMFAVIIMVLPYLLFSSDKYIHALITMLILIVLIILVFTYYISVAKVYPLRKDL